MAHRSTGSEAQTR